MDKKTMRQQFFILAIIITLGIIFSFKAINQDDWKIINVEEQIDWQTISSTWEDISTWNNNIESGFVFLNSECEFNYLSWTKYNYINIFDGDKRSPKDFKDYKSYTNVFYISWQIEEAYLCIVSSVVDWRKTSKYNYTTYILFNEPKYAWHIRVWYSKEKNVLYDYTTSKNKELYWRFWWYEAPKTYQENLESIIVANRESWDYTEIHPLERLKQEWRIRIWWFVNAINQEGIMKKFVIIYKWWEIRNTPF